MRTKLEHLNITVSDPDRTAALLVDLFDWTIRWKGPSALGGRTIHVGGPEIGDDYLAVYTYTDSTTSATVLNHVGILVEDLDATEQRIKDAGFEPHTHGDYEPGRRFYFDDHDGIEYEIISYAS